MGLDTTSHSQKGASGMKPHVNELLGAGRVMEIRSRRYKQTSWICFFAGAAYGIHFALRVLIGDDEVLTKMRETELKHQGER